MMQLLAGHDLVAQNQVLDLSVHAGGKIFAAARFSFRLS
jgi:hypothetical protein